MSDTPDNSTQQAEQARIESAKAEQARQEALAKEVSIKEENAARELAAKQAVASEQKAKTEGLHITHDANGRALPNTRRADDVFVAEDIKFKKAEIGELHDGLQRQAEKLLAGDKPDEKTDKLIRRIDNAAVLAELAPEGIRFGEQGRPDFTPYAIRQEVIEQGLNGKYDHDVNLANKSAGISNEAWQVLQLKFVWHHVEDGKTMQLIPRELHDAVRHVGGSYVIENGQEAVLTPATEQVQEAAFKEQARQEALARGANEENARKSAEERAELAKQQKALAEAEAKLTAQNTYAEVKAVMEKKEDLRDAAIAQAKAEAAREGRNYSGDEPRGKFERQASIDCDASEKKSKLNLEWDVKERKQDESERQRRKQEQDDRLRRQREAEMKKAADRQRLADMGIDPTQRRSRGMRP